MIIKEIRSFATNKGIILPSKAKKEKLIHLIQTAEGNMPCYATQKCNNLKCLWFKDCIKLYKQKKSHEKYHG